MRTAGHDRYREDVAAHALGALTRLEAVELKRHLQGCEACRADLERFRAVVDKLWMTVEPRTPRPQLKQELLRRIQVSTAPERPRGSRRDRIRGRRVRRGFLRP